MERPVAILHQALQYESPNLGNLHYDLQLSIINQCINREGSIVPVIKDLRTIRLLNKKLCQCVDTQTSEIVDKLSKFTLADHLWAAKSLQTKQSLKFYREHISIELEAEVVAFCLSINNSMKNVSAINDEKVADRAISPLIAKYVNEKRENNQLALIHIINRSRRVFPIVTHEQERRSLYVGGHMKIAELLYRHGILKSNHVKVLRWLCRFGNTIHEAIKTENEGFIDLLLQEGAHVNECDSYIVSDLGHHPNAQVVTDYALEDGMTPLDRIVQQVDDNCLSTNNEFCINQETGLLKRMEILLHRGGKSADENNYFVLKKTACRNNYKALQLLLDSRMDAKIINGKGNTLLHAAIKGLVLDFTDTDMVNDYTLPTLELLLKHDVNPDTTNHAQKTALDLLKADIDNARGAGTEPEIIQPEEQAFKEIKKLFKKYGATRADN